MKENVWRFWLRSICQVQEKRLMRHFGLLRGLRKIQLDFQMSATTDRVTLHLNGTRPQIRFRV